MVEKGNARIINIQLNWFHKTCPQKMRKLFIMSSLVIQNKYGVAVEREKLKINLRRKFLACD